MVTVVLPLERYLCHIFFLFLPKVRKKVAKNAQAANAIKKNANKNSPKINYVITKGSSETGKKATGNKPGSSCEGSSERRRK